MERSARTVDKFPAKIHATAVRERRGGYNMSKLDEAMQKELIDHEGNVLPRNLAVITLKQIMNGEAIIQLVSRDFEGDWQFLPCLEELSESDASIVGLGEIIKLDSSILAVLKMPLNYQAWRADKSSVWHYAPSEQEAAEQ